MANTILTPAAITRKALMLLHQKSVFIRNINRQYDSQYAVDGAKIGSDLRIRLPNQYVVRDGAALVPQDTTEQNVTLSITNQKGVDLNFTSKELTLDLDDYSERILEPAISVLAANIEADVLSLRNDVYNIMDNDGLVPTFKNVMQARKNLVDNLAPQDKNLCMMLSTNHNVELVDELKGLFQDSKNVSMQNKEGYMGRTGGFNFNESTLADRHLTGTAAKTTGYLINGASQTGSGVIVDTGINTFLAGDIVTFNGCNRVHPETKADTGQLQTFVVTADYSGSGTMPISPAIVTSGARQNVSASPTNNGAVVKLGAGASEYYDGSLAFHKDAFTFATADLIKPNGVHFCSRQVFEGISLRIIRDYTISDDQMPCRIDVLYGKKALRPQLATRFHADG